MTKQYSKGYEYEVHNKTLISPTMVVLSNKLPYGLGRLESHIFIENKVIRVLLTDGYKYLYDKSGFLSIKQAMNIIHGKMQDITNHDKDN